MAPASCCTRPPLTILPPFLSALLPSPPSENPDAEAAARFVAAGLDAATLRSLLRAAFTTFAVHVEGRAGAVMGQAFYTIGPCGEELMGAAALAMRGTDAVALHYRFVKRETERDEKRWRALNDAPVLDHLCSLSPPSPIPHPPRPSVAPHSHVAVQIMRQMHTTGRALDDVILDRARAHTVSTQDPVTGGAHCAIGGGPVSISGREVRRAAADSLHIG